MDISATSPPPKRQKIAYHHRHRTLHKPSQVPGEPALLPVELLDKLLLDSIKTICEEQAWKQGIGKPIIESVALEALRALVDEYILKLCSTVRRSMQAARRTVPIPPDFESAFYALDVPRLDDELAKYHAEADFNPPLLPTPPPEDEFHDVHQIPDVLLGPELSRQGDLKKFGFNIASLPPLPSAHTYKETAVFSIREKDSRRIRELATEEGKLGEQALRRLAGAVKLDSTLSSEPEARLVRARRGPLARRPPVLTEEAMFEETMRDLLRQEKGEFELGPVVSSEKMYRMPDEARMKTKSSVPASSAKEEKKYNVLPPPMSKAKMDLAPPSDRQDPADVSFEL